MPSFRCPLSLLCALAFQSSLSFKGLWHREHMDVESVDHSDSPQSESESRSPASVRRLTDQFKVLAISSQTTVAEGAALTLRKVRIVPASGFTATAFQVEGRLALTDCVVEDFESAVFSVTGEVAVTNSTFRNNREAAFFLSGAAAARLSQIEVYFHTGTFLLYRGNDRPLVFIQNSTFSDGIMKGTQAVILISTYAGAANVSVCGCTFTGNRPALLWLDVHSTAVSVRDCSFLSNHGQVLTLYQSEGSTELQSCQVHGNLHTVVSVRSLQGKLSVSDVQVFNHSAAMFFQVEHNGSSRDCSAEFNRISIEKSVTHFDVSSSAVFAVSACSVYVQNLNLQNVMLHARLGSNQVGLFVVYQGALHLCNCTAIDSGSSGALHIGYFSTSTFSHCSFANSTILQSVYFGMMLGDLAAEGIDFADMKGVDFANDFGLRAVYFAVSQSMLMVRDLLIFQNEALWSTAIVATRFSTFRVRNVELKNARMSVAVSLVGSSGEVISLSATGCLFSFYVYQTASNSELSITGVTIRSSTFMQKESGVLSLCTKSRVSLSSLAITGTKLSYFAKAKNSYLKAHAVSASNCHFNHLLRDVINSQLLISGLLLVNSTGGLVDSYNCNITFSDSLIDSISASGVLIRGSATMVELSDVTMANVTVGKAVAYLQEGSGIAMVRLSVRFLWMRQDQGFIINSGSVSIDGSEFAYFAGSLIQAYAAVASITSSTFEHGVNLIESRISQFAYGGVLGCIDCMHILIDDVIVRNVSSVYGGAASFRSLSNSESGVLEVKRSRFESCRAVLGGALYIRNVHFHIDGCTFCHNSAQESGGAIDVSVPANCTKSLRSLVLLSNSASEGGAVKWRKAQVLLQNITAANNSAQYGPDFASYGIELSSRQTFFSNSTASGYPLHLIYELLDHYGQRVTSSREELLRLDTSSNISFSGYTTVVRSNGLFNFTVPMVLAPPGSTQLLIARMDTEEAGTIVNQRAITFRQCVPGEVDKTNQCVYCFSGHVSFHPEARECSQCPKHAFCFGGTNMTVDSNYWRSSNDSLDLVECPMPGTCLGGSNNSCAHGYTGKLCNECSDGYYRYQMTGCEQCDEGAALYAQFIPTAAVAMLFTFLVSKCSASETRLYALKTMLSHAQLVSAISPLKGALPRPFHGFLHGLSHFSSLFLTDLPLSCMGVKNEPVVQAVVASCLLPFFAFLAAGIFMMRHNKQVVVCFTSCLLFVPTITTQSLFPLLACVSGGDGRRWLFTDMSQECWDTAHKRLFHALFLPSTSISVLVPLLLAIGVAFGRPARFLEYFPMWACGYRWAPWNIVQSALTLSLQILMYSGLGFSRIGQYSSGLIALYVLCFANVFFALKVYRGKEPFWLAECSFLIVTTCYSMSGVYVFTEKGYSGSAVTFSIVFLTVNCLFFVCCAYLLLCDFEVSHFIIRQYASQGRTCDTLSHKQDESFGEAIVPNNSHAIEPTSPESVK